MSDNFIAKNFSNLPLESLISAPLTAAANSNLLLANATYDFIQEVWVGGDAAKTNSASLEAKTLEFKVDKRNDKDEKIDQIVRAPMAALVETPNLMIRSVEVNFTMEVKDVTTSNTTVKADSNLSLSAKGVWWDAKLTGSLSASRSQSRSTDRSAKYEVTVRADQSEATEGMSRLAQIFASAIETRSASKTQS